MLDADRLRSLFLGFFAERGHAILPSASLVPQGDPSVLFTTAGGVWCREDHRLQAVE
jgi:alanyl-tRNA synthetase